MISANGIVMLTAIFITAVIVYGAEILTGLKIVSYTFKGTSTILVIVIGPAIYIFSILYFFWNKRYLKIVEKYSKQTEKEKKIGNNSMWWFLTINFF